MKRRGRWSEIVRSLSRFFGRRKESNRVVGNRPFFSHSSSLLLKLNLIIPRERGKGGYTTSSRMRRKGKERGKRKRERESSNVVIYVVIFTCNGGSVYFEFFHTVTQMMDGGGRKFIRGRE